MVEKEIIMAAIEDTEFEVLKADIEFYFARLVNRDLEKAKSRR